MKKKNIIILVSIIVILVVIGILFILIQNNNNGEANIPIPDEESGISRLNGICDKLEENPNYTFKTVLNDENQMTIARKDESAYVESVDEGEKTIYIVKDDNTTLLVEDTKEYYTYENNSTYLTKVTNNMKQLLKENFLTGKEKINNKEYYYEEYNESYPFLINYKSTIDDSKTKTRLYFEGSSLKYIKTYIGDVEQLLKVDISYNVDDNISFEIPEEYNEG